jgi:hypothetical protein
MTLAAAEEINEAGSLMIDADWGRGGGGIATRFG